MKMYGGRKHSCVAFLIGAVVILFLTTVCLFDELHRVNVKLETLLEAHNETRSILDEIRAEIDEKDVSQANIPAKEKVEENPLKIENTSEAEKAYLGEFRITHYCHCAKCNGKWANQPTASGVMPEVGRTIAVDPTVVPLGSVVEINGKEYVAEDTGSAIKGNRIDIFVESHELALDLGRYYADVYMKAE